MLVHPIGTSQFLIEVYMHEGLEQTRSALMDHRGPCKWPSVLYGWQCLYSARRHSWAEPSALSIGPYMEDAVSPCCQLFAHFSAPENPTQEDTLSRIFRCYSCWQADPGPLISLLLLFSKLSSEPEMPRGSCGWLGTSGNEQVKETREFSRPNNFPLFFFFLNTCTNRSF